MDNNQPLSQAAPVPPQQPVPQQPVAAPPPPVQPQITSQVLQNTASDTQAASGQGNSPKSNKNKMFLGGLLAMLIVVILACGGIYFYMSSSPDKVVTEATPVAQNVTVAPTQEVVSDQKIVVVETGSDLDGLLVELARADESLDKELTAFDADSNF
jgi:hypothetical protein